MTERPVGCNEGPEGARGPVRGLEAKKERRKSNDQAEELPVLRDAKEKHKQQRARITDAIR